MQTGGNAELTVNGGTIRTAFAGGNEECGAVTVKVNGGHIETLYASGMKRVGAVYIIIGSGTVTNLYKTAPNGKPADTVSVTGSNGKIFTGWDSSEKAIFITAELLGMQLRLSGTQGLRFIAEIRGDYQNGVSEYGAVVLPETLLNGEELTLDTPRAAVVSSAKSGFKIFDSDDESVRYTVCITGILPKHYNRRYCVRAYIKYSDAQGEHIVYTDTMTGDIMTTVKGIRDQYPGMYDDLYERINKEYSATFVSAGEFRKKVMTLSDGTYQKLSPDYAFTGKALYTDGTETENADWEITDFLSVSDYTVLQYCLSAKSGIASLAFYDENKQYISGVTSSASVGSDGYNVIIYQTEIPENAAYVRLSRHKDFALSSVILSYDIGKEVNDYCLTKDASTLDGKKILCVGDSLTYGDYGTTVPGRGYPHGENYPYYLSLYTGASVEWYARGGYTATQLYRDYHDGIFSGAGRDGEYSAKDADYVIVMLGTNGGLTLNDTTHYDSYCRLIEALQNDMKSGAQLILMTPPHATEDTSKVNCGYAPNVVDAYSAVYRLAKSYDLPVFDVYRDSGLSERNEEIMQPNDGLHFGGVGYSVLAAFVTNELKLLNGGKLGELTAEEENDKEDAAFLETVEYPSFELCDGRYKTFGRWFTKTVDGVLCDVTTTSGSQIFFMTNGADSFTVDFRDETACTTAKPYYAVSIDGKEPVRYPITQNTVMLPDSSRHAIWLIMDGLYENEDKWNGEVGFAVGGISVNRGILRAVMPKNEIVFYYGDSITEGVNAVGTTTDGASNSATHSYAFYSAKALSAIPYYIGYGASGLVRTGSFKEMATAMEKLSASKDVDFSVKPSKIVINHGYNDAYFNSAVAAITSEEFTNALNTTLDKLYALYAATPVYYVIPINQSYADEIRAAAERYSDFYTIETESIEFTKTDGIHPDAASAEKMGKTVADTIMKTENRTHTFDSYITYRAPLQNTAKTLRDNKKLTVAYFGGSVTAGYGASDFDEGGRATDKNSWRAQTTAWLKETYPDAEIESIYAAIGESGTYLGTYIVQDYVIAKSPDLVFIEYAINDTYGGFDKTRAALQLETIVREIGTALPKTDIVILLSGDKGQLSSGAWYFPTAQGHAEIAEHYNLPQVYMGRALYDYIQTNSLSWSTFYKDSVHPLDAGYAYYFETVKEYLHNALLCTQYGDTYDERSLPDLYSDYLLDGERTLVYATEEMADGNDGWSRSSANINPVFSKKGSIVQTVSDDMTPFTYTFSGTEFAIYTNLYASAQYELTVDGVRSVGTFSGHNPTTVVSGLSSGTHTITIKPIADTVPSGTAYMQIDAVMFRDASKQTQKSAD